MATTNNKFIPEPFNASSYRVAIIWCQFNKDMTGVMKETAINCLSTDYNMSDDSIDVFKVAGAADVGSLLAALAKSGRYDCVFPLGVIIQGETNHFDYVAKSVSDAISLVSTNYALAIPFGILTVNTIQQTLDRLAHTADYVHAGMHNARLIKEILTVDKI